MDELNRKLLYLGVCIPVRLLLVYLLYTVRSKKVEKKSMVTKEGMLFIVSMIGFGLITAYTYRSFTCDKEHFGASGGKVYWNSNIHGMIYLLTAIFLLWKPDYAWIVLLMDMIPAIYFFMMRYYKHVMPEFLL